jgi:hypothetical protein
MSKKYLVVIQPISDRCGYTKKPWGYLDDSSETHIVVFSNNSYDELPPGSKVWAKIVKGDGNPKYIAEPISVNGKPYLNQTHQQNYSIPYKQREQ